MSKAKEILALCEGSGQIEPTMIKKKVFKTWAVNQMQAKEIKINRQDALAIPLNGTALILARGLKLGQGGWAVMGLSDGGENLTFGNLSLQLFPESKEFFMAVKELVAAIKKNPMMSVATQVSSVKTFISDLKMGWPKYQEKR